MPGIVDIIVIVAYLAGITLLGVWTARRVKSLAEFIMPHRFGKAMMLMHTFGTGTHSDQAVGVAAKTYTSGLSGIWYQWLWLFPTPFYWLIAPVMRRFRAVTTADIYQARYGRSVAVLFAVVGMFQLSTTMGTMLKGSGEVISAAIGGAAPVWAIILIMTALFVAYGAAGGLNAAIVTDFVQGILTVIFSFLLLPFIMDAVGGLAGMREKIHDPEMFSIVAPSEIGFFYITVIAVNALIGWVAQPHNLGLCAAGRTELEGRVGTMGGSFLKRICTVAWCLTGLAALAYFAGREVNPDQVYGLAAREFLPRILPGLLGVFLASLLASVMSSCDSFMVASSGLFTENIYRPLVKGRSETHYLNVARLASLAVVALGVIYAFWLPDVVKGIEIFWKIGPMMGIAFWLGLFWRRATAAGAWASTLTGFAVWWLTTREFFIDLVSRLAIAEEWKLIRVEDGISELQLPWQMICYLSAAIIAGIVVSLFTRPADPEQLDNFYALTRTPITPGEEVAAPCTLPKGVTPPPARKLIPIAGLEILAPSRTSLVGFIIGWILVGAIIGSVVLIIK